MSEIKQDIRNGTIEGDSIMDIGSMVLKKLVTFREPKLAVMALVVFRLLYDNGTLPGCRG